MQVVNQMKILALPWIGNKMPQYRAIRIVGLVVAYVACIAQPTSAATSQAGIPSLLILSCKGSSDVDFGSSRTWCVGKERMKRFRFWCRFRKHRLRERLPLHRRSNRNQLGPRHELHTGRKQRTQRPRQCGVVEQLRSDNTSHIQRAQPIQVLLRVSRDNTERHVPDSSLVLVWILRWGCDHSDILCLHRCQSCG